MNVHNFMNFDNFWSLLVHLMVLPACFKKGHTDLPTLTDFSCYSRI